MASFSRAGWQPVRCEICASPNATTTAGLDYPLSALRYVCADCAADPNVVALLEKQRKLARKSRKTSQAAADPGLPRSTPITTPRANRSQHYLSFTRDVRPSGRPDQRHPEMPTPLVTSLTRITVEDVDDLSRVCFRFVERFQEDGSEYCSPGSPIGIALLNSAVGEELIINVPSGLQRLRVLSQVALEWDLGSQPPASSRARDATESHVLRPPTDDRITTWKELLGRDEGSTGWEL
jgi:hypothetical protein